MEHMLKRAYFAQMHKKSQVSLKNLIDKNMGAYPGESFFDETVQLNPNTVRIGYSTRVHESWGFSSFR